MSEDEKYVRERFPSAEYRAADKYAHGFPRGRVYAKHPTLNAEWILSGNSNYPFETTHAVSEVRAWALARAFVEKLEAEIDDVKNEISALQCWIISLRTDPEIGKHEIAVCERILAGRQDALNELMRGM